MFFWNTISAMGFFPQPEGAFPNCPPERAASSQPTPTLASRCASPRLPRPMFEGGRNSSMRREALGRLLCALSVMLACADSATAAEIKVTLLGTGTPTPRLSAFSASTLVEAGGERLIFDFGRGSSIRLFQKKIPIGSISAHFVTHLHSDHVVGLPDMWLTGWIGTPYGSRKTPMVIFGPKGTVAMTENLSRAFSEDIRLQIGR